MLGIALAIPNPCDNKGMRSEYEFKKTNGFVRV